MVVGGFAALLDPDPDLPMCEEDSSSNRLIRQSEEVKANQTQTQHEVKLD